MPNEELKIMAVALSMDHKLCTSFDTFLHSSVYFVSNLFAIEQFKISFWHIDMIYVYIFFLFLRGAYLSLAIYLFVFIYFYKKIYIILYIFTFFP